MFIHTCPASTNYAIVCVLGIVGLENNVSSDLAPIYAQGCIFPRASLTSAPSRWLPVWSSTVDEPRYHCPRRASSHRSLCLWPVTYSRKRPDKILPWKYCRDMKPGRRVGATSDEFYKVRCIVQTCLSHIFMDAEMVPTRQMRALSLTHLWAAPTSCYREKNENITPLSTIFLPKSTAGVQKQWKFLNLALRINSEKWFVF